MEDELFRGHFEDVHFPELLLQISQRRQTGVLHVVRGRVENDIYFHDGRVVFAKSNDPDQRLGELLLRRGKVTRRQLQESASKIQPGMRLGTILVQDGHLKASDLYQGVIDQVEEIVYSVFEWSDGEYEFAPGELPSKEVITLSISTPDVILAGVSRIWRWSWISRAVGDLDTVYVKSAECPALAKKMAITPILKGTLDLLDRPVRLEDILMASRINSFETCRLLWSFLAIGLIEQVKPAAAEEQPEDLLQPEVTTDIFAPAVEESAHVAEALPEAVREEVRVPQDEAAEGKSAMEITQPVVSPVFASDPPTPAPDLSFADLADLTDATRQPAEEQAPPAPPPQDSWDEDLACNIRKFNELHRYLFEVLRMEIGTGAANFIAKIIKKASSRFPYVFEGARLTEFGDFEEAALEANVRGNLVEQYKDAFDFLLQDEKATMSSFLDRKRIETIEAGLQRIAEKQAK